MLKDVSLAPDFPIRMLAESAEGLSGSDLRELCRNAAMVPVREYVRQAGGNAALLAQGQAEVRLSLLWPSWVERTHFAFHRDSTCGR